MPTSPPEKIYEPIKLKEFENPGMVQSSSYISKQDEQTVPVPIRLRNQYFKKYKQRQHAENVRTNFGKFNQE